MSEYRGSAWRYCDLHVHSPASYTHDFSGKNDEEMWRLYLDALAKIDGLSVVGITDYFSLKGYERVNAAWTDGDLRNLDLVIPNVEIRLDISTKDNKPINLHIIASPEIADELPSLLLGKLVAPYKGEEYSARWDDLVRFGRVYRGETGLIEEAAFKVAAQYFKPSLRSLVDAYSKSERLRRLTLVALPNSDRDGNSGLREEGLKVVREQLYRLSDVVISANPADREFFLGHTEKLSPEEIVKAFGSLKPCIGGSDAHRLEDIGKPDLDRLTWIKADPTFEGIRQICFEPKHRIQISKHRPNEPIHRIDSLQIELPADTTLGDDGELFCLRGTHRMTFGPGFTCLIGGRGSGKSTILALLEEAIAGSSDFFNDLPLYSCGSRIKPGDHVTAETSSGATEVEFLHQNQIEVFALDQAKLTDAIFSRLVNLDSEGTLAAARSSIGSALRNVGRRIEIVEQLNDVRRDTTALKAERQATARLVESLQDEIYKGLRSRSAELNEDLAEAREGRVRLARLIDELEAILEGDVDVDYASLGSHPAGGGYWERLSKLRADVRAASDEARADNDLSVPSEEERTIKAELDEVDSKIRSYLEERGISDENVRDLTGASEKLVSLDRRIAELERLITGHEEALTEAESSIPDNVREDFAAATQNLVQPINESLLAAEQSELARISLRHRFDGEAARQAVVDWIYEQINERREGRSVRIDYLSRVLDNVDFESLPTLPDLLKAVNETAGGERTTAKQIGNFFAELGVYERLALVTERAYTNAESFQRLEVLYDKKPLSQASFGQRCSAALIVLLMLGNTPIVVDEPEAHLDSALIAELLVSLIKDRQSERQIIFATHNANFVVNGDAELVQVLELASPAPTKFTPTSLENLEHRPEILRLEGGASAFRHREDRYGFRQRLPGVPGSG